MTEFIDEHRDVFGVEPICHVLSHHGVTMAPSTYYDARKRPPSKPALRDAQIESLIIEARSKPFVARYGTRKIWLHLRRQGPRRGLVHGGAADDTKTSCVTHPVRQARLRDPDGLRNHSEILARFMVPRDVHDFVTKLWGRARSTSFPGMLSSATDLVTPTRVSVPVGTSSLVPVPASPRRKHLHPCNCDEPHKFTWQAGSVGHKEERRGWRFVPTRDRRCAEPPVQARQRQPHHRGHRDSRPRRPRRSHENPPSLLP